MITRPTIILSLAVLAAVLNFCGGLSSLAQSKSDKPSALRDNRKKLVFPDFAIGRVYTVNPGWIDNDLNPKGKLLAIARGTVYVPAGKQLIIELHDLFNSYPHALATVPDGLIKMLDFHGAGIEDKTIEVLSKQKNLTGLRRINLTETEVSDACVPYLARFTGLRGLSLQSTNVRGTTLGALQAVSKLTCLHVGCNDLKPVAFDHIGSLKNIERLNVSRTQMTDLLSLKLTRLAKLQVAELNENPRFSDKGLSGFKVCKALIHYDLRNTAVTPAGIRAACKPKLASITLAKDQFGRSIEERLITEIMPVTISFDDREKQMHADLFKPLK